jgi:hypothetical protein
MVTSISAMKHEGSLHILRFGPDPATGAERYSITYAPDDRRGGALPPYVVRSDSDLRRFLREIELGEPEVSRALTDVKLSGRVSLPSIVLSNDQLSRYGLGEMGIIQSVISYLST